VARGRRATRRGEEPAGPVNCPQLFTELYRRYVGRRPSRDETAVLFSLFGPGDERVTLDPEAFVRRLFNEKRFPESPLGRTFPHDRTPRGDRPVRRPATVTRVGSGPLHGALDLLYRMGRRNDLPMATWGHAARQVQRPQAMDKSRARWQCGFGGRCGAALAGRAVPAPAGGAVEGGCMVVDGGWGSEDPKLPKIPAW
jgi:hypothetical protein